MFNQSIQRLGFACKYLDPDQSQKKKLLEESQRPLNTRATTVAWLNRQTQEDAEQRECLDWAAIAYLCTLSRLGVIFGGEAMSETTAKNSLSRWEKLLVGLMFVFQCILVSSVALLVIMTT
jgi:hypothetical protein